MLLKIEKTIKDCHRPGGPCAKSARGLFGRLLLGPKPDSQQPGPPKRPAARLPPPSVWAACQPKRRGAILAVDPGSDGRPCSSQEQKGRRRRPPNPRLFLSPLALSTRRRRPWRSRTSVWRRRRGFLAGARTRRTGSAPPSGGPVAAPRTQSPRARPSKTAAARVRLSARQWSCASEPGASGGLPPGRDRRW